MTTQTPPKLEELYELRYCPHCNRMVNSQKATEKNISQLRTWINEKPKDRLVTNEDIKMWLYGKENYEK